MVRRAVAQVPVLPATLRELTLHSSAPEPGPLTVGVPAQRLGIGHLTQLERLVLAGSAYRGLDAEGSHAEPAVDDAAATSLLPASLRTLVLQDCSDDAAALRVLRHPRLRPPPGATLGLHGNERAPLHWRVYLDASPRPPPAGSDCGAWLPAGFAALRLRMPRVAFSAQYDLGSVPRAPPQAAELLCRLFGAAPESYSQFRVYVPPASGLIVGVSGERIRKTANHEPPAVPGDAEERFKTAEALVKRAWCCACHLGLRACTARIDGDACAVMSRVVG